MNRKAIYLIFCILGLVLPYWQFIPWVLAHGMNFPLFFGQLFANPIGGFFGMDVLVSAIVLISFIRVESRRTHIRSWWLPIGATLLVGVSLGLPLFLYLRECALEQAAPKIPLSAGLHS
jgi:Terpene cyclase DEP1